MEYSNELLGQLREKAKRLRRGVIECIGVGNAGHVGGGCSCADIVAALYFYKMRYDPKDPAKKDRDRFLLSKGHAAIVQYAALAEAGFFPREELPKTKSLGAMLQGHPDRLKTPGVEAGTGSLGQGLSIGLGMALAQRLDGLDSNTYVILGDGEIAEGQIWEAAMDGPCYIRVNRNDYDNVTAEDAPFVIGQPTVLREGKDVTVFATGYMVSLALQAAEQVEDKADVKVVNVSTLKPLNNEAIRQLAAGSRGVVTAEEHSVIGGLGGAVAQALAPAPIPMSFVGIEDCFGCSAHSYGELLEHFGLTARHIAEEILKFVD